MLNSNYHWIKFKLKSFLTCVLLLTVCWGLVSCSSDSVDTILPSESESEYPLSEVAPPPVIQKLGLELEQYQPQVKIVSPQANETLEDNTVTVQFQVEGLPIFKEEDLGLGTHLHLIVDNQPYQAVYDVEQPLVLSDLEAGTHTLRVFASRPWHESFKNEGAYDQVTFNIFTQTEDNNPSADLPLLTYSRPNGSYGAEPIMLDFYLANAPSHSTAQENPDDPISDWQVRATVNGSTFLIDSWEPVYLEGFETGKNWVHLELVDGQGNLIDNVFNDTVRTITYEPGGQDTLSKIVRGELSVDEVKSIIDPDYTLVETAVVEEEIPESESTAVLEEANSEVPEVVEDVETPVVEEEISELESTTVLEEANSEVPEVVEDAETAVVEEEISELESTTVLEEANSEVPEVVEDAETAVVEEEISESDSTAVLEEANSEVVEDVETPVLEEETTESESIPVVEDVETAVVEEEISESESTTVVEEVNSEVPEVVEDLENPVVEEEISEPESTAVLEEANSEVPEVVEDAETPVVEEEVTEAVENSSAPAEELETAIEEGTQETKEAEV